MKFNKSWETIDESEFDKNFSLDRAYLISKLFSATKIRFTKFDDKIDDITVTIAKVNIIYGLVTPDDYSFTSLSKCRMYKKNKPLLYMLWRTINIFWKLVTSISASYYDEHHTTKEAESKYGIDLTSKKVINRENKFNELLNV